MIEQYNKTKKGLERLYCKKSSNKVYTVLEDSNFHWSEKEVREFQEMWVEGLSTFEMSEQFERPEEEVICLMLDQALKKYISPRKGGLYGM